VCDTFVAEEMKREIKCRRRSPSKGPFVAVLLVSHFESICSYPLPSRDPAIRSRRDVNVNYRPHRRDGDAYMKRLGRGKIPARIARNQAEPCHRWRSDGQALRADRRMEC
jgi:hypothetical protein